MAAGYDLKEGKYDQTYKSAAEIKNTFALFFENGSRKESTYKYVMFKAIIDNLDTASNKIYKLSFDQLFARFSEVYWVLVFKHKIPQKPPSVKTPYTLAEKIINDTVKKYKIRRKTEFRSLSGNIQREVIQQMKKKCSRYVIGALYAETNQLFYSFSKEKEWIKLNPLVVDYIKKHEKNLQSQNYHAWGSFYSDVVSFKEKDEGYFRRLLKREFGDNSVIFIAPLVSEVKKNPTTKKIANASIESPDSYDPDIAVKARNVLSQYPNLGLYLVQVCEKIDEDREKVRAVLDNSFWCRREGRRYYYIDVSDSDIVTEAMFSEDYSLLQTEELADTGADDIDLEKILLLDDPELLIKQLKKEKGIRSTPMVVTPKDKRETKKTRTISAASVQKKWEREEVVILVTEYFRTKAMSKEQIEESQKRLSSFLRRREEQITGTLVDDTFRNFAGIRMQSGRIRCLDPDSKYSGMQGTKLQIEIVKEYLANPNKIKREAKAIVEKYGGSL